MRFGRTAGLRGVFPETSPLPFGSNTAPALNVAPLSVPILWQLVVWLLSAVFLGLYATVALAGGASPRIAGGAAWAAQVFIKDAGRIVLLGYDR